MFCGIFWRRDRNRSDRSFLLSEGILGRQLFQPFPFWESRLNIHMKSIHISLAPMKFKFPGRDSVFSVSWSSPGGPLWPPNSGPFACLYGGGPQITRPPSEKVPACLSLKWRNSFAMMKSAQSCLVRFPDCVFSSISRSKQRVGPEINQVQGFD